MGALLETGFDVAGILMALVLAGGRPLGFVIVLPLFSRFGLQGGLLRGGVVIGLSIPVMAALLPQAATVGVLPMGTFALALGKEMLLGLLIGLFIGLPFWAAAAAGDFIDHQRSAAIASTIDPGSGDEVLPTGTFLFLTMVILVAASGMFAEILLGALYQSYGLWPVLAPVPDLDRAAVEGFLSALTRTGLVLGLPIVGALLTVEIAIAFATKYITQMSPFFLAMSVKQVAYIFLMPAYFVALLTFMGGEIRSLGAVLDTLMEAP